MMINKKQMWSDNPFDQWTEEELLCMKYQGICYGKGGGGSPPPPPATQTVRQSSEFPAELKPFVSDIFSKAQAVQEQRQEEGFRPELTQQLASFTPDQQAAFTGIREQVGQTRPLFEEATNLARSATRAATDPAEVADLMNPFLRNVTDIEKREAQRVADVQEQQLAAQAAQAGAFGGSRAAVLEAERQRNLAQQLGDIEARGRAAAFQDAQARLENQFAREGAGAAQLSALGAAIPAQTFKELGALSGVGAAEQQQAQRALDIATQQAREEYGFPMQTLQDFQSILRGFPLPATTNISRQTFSPAQPLATQLLGLGTGLAGLAGAAGAFRKAGGLVGAPVAMKDGGYVKLAGGGGLGQLMQGKLPSNRVRMGKTAYQNATPIASTELLDIQMLELEPLLRRAIGKPASEARRILKEASDKFSPELVEAGAKALKIENLLPSAPGAYVSPANVATQSIQAAGTAATPVPSSKKLSSIMSPPPVDEQAQTVTTNLNLPQLMSGQTLDPGGAAPALDKMRPGLIQRIRSQFPYAGSVSPTLGTTAKDAPPPPPPALPLITQMGAQGLPIEDDTTPTRLPLTEAQIRRGIGAAKRRTTAEELTKNIPDDSSTALDKFSTEQAVDGDLPSEPLVTPDDDDINLAAEAASAQAGADAVREEAKAAATKAAKTATDPEGKPRPEPKTEIDPDKPVESVARRELGDYYKDAEKLLGKPPELEKGEEEDFASRKWLALAQFGTNMLRAGGDKTVFQAIGEAAQPALKELVAISKEEKKLKSDLRKERNAEKQRQYSDRIAKLGIAQKLQSADLDHTRAMADIADKKARRIIDEKTLAERARANTALINKQIIDTATAQYALDNAKTGRTTSGQAQKAILDSIQTTRNTIIKNRQFGYRINAEEENRQIMNAARQTAALYAPTTVKEVKGEDGKIRFEKVDLTKFIPNLGGTPKGGTAVPVPGRGGATVTMQVSG